MVVGPPVPHHGDMTTDRYTQRSTTFVNNARRTVSQFRMPANPVAKVAVVVLSIIAAVMVAKLAFGVLGFAIGLVVGLVKLVFGIVGGLLGLVATLAVPLLIMAGIVILVKALRK